MKKKGLYSSLLLSALILAACNTKSEEVLETSASSEQPTEEIQQAAPIEQAPTEEIQPTQNEAEPVPVKPVQEQPTEEQPQVAVTQPVTPLVTSTSATLNYTISHLENYTLSEEEPGKDMLFYNENDALSMRIEVFNQVDASFETLNAATQQSMAAIAPNNTYESFDLTSYLTAATRTDIKLSASYIVKYESDKVTAIVYEIEDKVIVLTIFDDYITGITDAFITAGLTIH